MGTKRWWWFLVPMVLGVGFLTFARASASGPFCGGFRGHHAAASAAEVEEHLSDKVEHLLDAVSATEAQRKQADALVTSLSPQVFGLMTEGRSLRGELKTALLAEKLDHVRIDALRTRLAELSERFLDTGMDSVVQLSELLTPAQRKQVADKLARFHL